jgi:hypothetical protein
MAMSTPCFTGGRRLWQWSGPSGRYAIVLRQDLQADEARFVCRYPAQLFNAALGDPVLWRVLLEVWTHLRGEVPRAARTLSREYYRRYFLPGLEDAFRNGQLVLLFHWRETVYGPSGPEAAPAARQAQAAVETPSGRPSERKREEPERTWIEIVLVDDKKRPIPFEEFILFLPNGTPQPGRLDKEGKARVEGLDPGTCRVVFPRMDATEWWRA